MFYALGEVQVPVMPYLVTIGVAFALCFLVVAWTALLDSDAETAPVRALQRLRLRTTRLERMLRRRSIDVPEYVRMLTVPELKQQIETCKNCGLVDLCDRCLESRVPATAASFSFCPNRPAIEAHVLGRAPVTA